MPYRWTLTDLNSPYLGSEVLTSDPIGWDEGTYTIKRSELYKGAFHEYTTSLKFHCDGGGKEFVDTVYQTFDIDGRIDVLVEYDCDGSGVYDTLFNGIINLASYKTDGEYTTVNIEKSDLLTKLFNRDEISVDLETTTSIGGSAITAIDTTTLNLHSQNIYFKSAAEGESYPLTTTVISNVVNGQASKGFIASQITNIITEADYFTGWNEFTDFSHPGYDTSTTSLPPIFESSSLDVEYPATYTYNANFSGTFWDRITVANTRINSSHVLNLAWGDTLFNAIAIGNFVSLYSSGGYTFSGTDDSIAFDTTPQTGNITLNFGDSVWLYWFENETITTGPYTSTLQYDYIYDIAEISIEINSIAATTTAKTVLVHEAFNQVIDAIADSNNNFYSNFYGRIDSEKVSYDEDGCGSKIAFTNGLSIRKIAKPIHVSFKELFENFDCLHNIGMGIVGGVVRVEPISYWFDGATKIISLPNVNQYEESNDNSKYINKVDIGYANWEAEFRGGLDEVCTKHEYSTEISSVKNPLTKIAQFIASGYSIEFTRRKWNDEQTQDWRYDNNGFVIAVQRKFYGDLRFTATNSLKVNNASFSNMSNGDTLIISGTGTNDGVYTVASFSIGTFSTTITLVETVNTESISAYIENITNPIYKSEIYSDAFNYGSGMVSLDTAYNLRLTPSRMLLPHLKTVTAGLQVIQGNVKFVKGSGNTELQCSNIVTAYTDGCPEEYKGQQLSEKQSFIWNDSNVLNIEPIWLPTKYKFDYPLTYNEFKTIKANPYGYVEFYKFSDDIKSGFILNMEYKMKTGMTTFELLKKY
jgi:hypothetical protein